MNCDINILITPTDNPYRNYPGSSYDLWGRIIIDVCNEVLIDCEWDIFTVIEWYYEHKSTLVNTLLPNEYSAYRNLSYAQIHDLIGSQIDDSSDDAIVEKVSDELQRAFAKHRFFIRGTNTLRFFIGRDFYENGEISYYDEGKVEYIIFKFSMSIFIEKMDAAIKDFLLSWRSHHYSEDAYHKLLSSDISKYLPLE
jgi:hypothetical protein